MSQIAFQFQSRISTSSILKSISTTSLYTSRPTTFGQLAFPDLTSSTMSSTPACPCCAFLTTNGALFLPWNTEEDDDGEACVVVEGTLLSAEGIMTPNEAWDRISMSSSVVDNDERQQILLVDTHGHPHLSRDVQYATTPDISADDQSVYHLHVRYHQSIGTLH